MWRLGLKLSARCEGFLKDAEKDKEYLKIFEESISSCSLHNDVLVHMWARMAHLSTT